VLDVKVKSESSDNKPLAPAYTTLVGVKLSAVKFNARKE
tara:strand:+ start:123 stop:239 length:117 start_codon:yes stop_codon:yes gene_type:complete